MKKRKKYIKTRNQRQKAKERSLERKKVYSPDFSASIDSIVKRTLH